MSSESASAIAPLWRLRFLQKNQEVLEGLQKLSAAENETHAVEIKVLKASLLRSQGKVKESTADLQSLQQKSDGLPFQFYLQRGINLFAAGEYSLALEFWARAQSMAQTPFDKLAASSNILLCLENLNLPTESKLSEVQKYLRQLQDDQINQAMEQHLLAFSQRQNFRAGQISFLAESVPFAPTQAYLHRFWVAGLPYVEIGKNLDPQSLVPLLGDQPLYMRGFRLKTLLGDSRLTEEDKIDLREYVDRLYLWTWQWLTEPSDHRRENLKECLENFPLESFHKKLTGEDILMLRNSLGWILLFQPGSRNYLKPMLDLLSAHKVLQTPIFEIESLLIEYLSALQKKEPSQTRSLRARIKKHPLYQSADLLWPDWLAHFSAEIKKMQNKPGARFYMDLVSYKIKAGKKEFVSEPIVKILQALLQHESLHFAEVLEIGFGIRGYDEELHKAKIHNIISRIREILPKKLKIYSRQQRVYLQGPPQEIGFSSASPLQTSLMTKILIPNVSAENKAAALDRWVHPRLILKQARGQKEVSRHELQKMARASKATTNRWIQKWLECGLLRKSGHGKSTAYLIEII